MLSLLEDFQINASERERGGYQMTALILLQSISIQLTPNELFLQKQLDISHARQKKPGVTPQ